MSHYIEHDAGAYHVYALDRTRRYRIGPPKGWPTPKEAARFADLLDHPSTNPLRDPGVASPVASVPPPGAAGVEVTPGPRERTRRTGTAAR